MKTYLGILLFLISLSASAQKTLSPNVFQANVRPVLTSIVRDFYQMVEQFPDFPKNIRPLLEELEGLAGDRETLRATCPRTLGSRCKQTVNSLRKKLQTLKELSLSLLHDQKLSSSMHINTLSGFRLLTQFDNSLEELKGHLDNSSFLEAAGLGPRRETSHVLKQIDELSTLVSLSVVEFIPYNYREEFRHFYFNFVTPVEKQLSKGNGYEYFNKNLNSLNFTLNLLNMNLTKKNKKTPEGMAPFLSVIHNKWNGILRNYL